MQQCTNQIHEIHALTTRHCRRSTKAYREMTSIAKELAPPFFSVVIPTHNRGVMLRRALASVQRQTFRNFEIVIIDDGSDEDIAAVVKHAAPSANFLRLDRNSGIPVARNAALKLAHGRYIAFLDSDDIWHPRYLQYNHAALQALPHSLFTFSNYYSNGPHYSGPVQQVVAEADADNALLHMIMRPYVHTMSCFVAPRSSMCQLGGFNQNLQRFSDLDLYVRLLAGSPRRKRLACLDHPAPNIPQVLVEKTLHTIDRSIEIHLSEWDKYRNAFLDQVFSYRFMEPYVGLRELCAEKLALRQRTYFSNFTARRLSEQETDQHQRA